MYLLFLLYVTALTFTEHVLLASLSVQLAVPASSLYYSCKHFYGTTQGLITALFSVGGLFGALIGGPLSDYIGRKPVLIIGGCLVAMGGLIHTAAVHIALVIMYRGTLFVLLTIQ